MQIYIILKSRDDVLLELDAWSDNYYLASVYYRQFKERHPDALFQEIKLEDDGTKAIQLAKILKREYDTSVDDIVMSELHLISSKDKKMCVIHKSKYYYSFSTQTSDISSVIFDEFKYALVRVFLVPATLVKYINTNTDILELLFKSYGYIMLGQKSVEFDMVYLWFFILKTSTLSFISNLHRDIIPVDSVFIKVL